MFGSDVSPANVAVVVLDTVVVFRGMQFIAVEDQGEPGLGRSAYRIRWVNDDAPLVVPEPSTALLLGMALLGLSLRRGRAAVPPLL